MGRDHSFPWWEDRFLDLENAVPSQTHAMAFNVAGQMGATMKHGVAIEGGMDCVCMCYLKHLSAFTFFCVWECVLGVSTVEDWDVFQFKTYEDT